MGHMENPENVAPTKLRGHIIQFHDDCTRRELAGCLGVAVEMERWGSMVCITAPGYSGAKSRRIMVRAKKSDYEITGAMTEVSF